MRLDNAQLIRYPGGRHLHAIQCGCASDSNATTVASSAANDTHLSQQQRLSYGPFSDSPDDTLPVGESTRLLDPNMSTFNNSTADDVARCANTEPTSILAADAQQRMLDITPPPSPTGPFNGDDAEVLNISANSTANNNNQSLSDLSLLSQHRLISIDEGIGASPVSDIFEPQVQSLCRRVSVHLHDCMKSCYAVDGLLECTANAFKVAGMAVPEIANLSETEVNAFVDVMFPIDERLVLEPASQVESASVKLKALPRQACAPIVVLHTTNALPALASTAEKSEEKPAKVRKAKRKADAADWDSNDVNVAGYDVEVMEWVSTCDARCNADDDCDEADGNKGDRTDIVEKSLDCGETDGITAMPTRTDSGYVDTISTLKLDQTDRGCNDESLANDINKTTDNDVHQRPSCLDSGFGDASSYLLQTANSTIDESPTVASRPSDDMPHFNTPAETTTNRVGISADTTDPAADDDDNDDNDDDHACIAAASAIMPTMAVSTDEEFAQRVSDWHRSLRATLERSEREIHFDIKAYGCRILTALQQRADQSGTFDVVLSAVQNAEQSSTMARTFISMLELVNAGKVRLRNANTSTTRVTDFDELTVRLMPVDAWHSVKTTGQK